MGFDCIMKFLIISFLFTVSDIRVQKSVVE